MNRWVNCALLLVLGLLVLGAGLAGGVLLDRLVLFRLVPPQGVPADARADFQLMAEAWDTIQASYVDRASVQPQALTYGAIGGMVDALGDTGHSRFLSPDMLKQEHDFTQGQFEGIGAYIEMKDGHVVIQAPIDGSPAQQAGLRPGDIIVGVNGEDISGLTLDQARAKIVGPAGTSVTLTIMDPNTGQQRDVTVMRARITVRNVTWQLLPGTTVAHVRIAAFSAGVTDDLKTALGNIRQQGLTGIVLDLRSNPGGLLDEAIGTASQFLGSGNVLLEKNAKGETTPVPVKQGGVALDLPMVLLINQGTASASEIVAGALQDGQRAKLVGETTFGTGTVLNEFGLSDGSALLLATQEWLTPAGRTIWHHGIAPDVEVSLQSGALPLTPEGEKGMTAAQLQASEDAQLLRGLELLTGPAGQPVPTMTPQPTSTEPVSQTQTVTLDNDGQTITLRTGDQFLLKLGDQYEWTIEVADPTIVSRVVNITVVKGAQGVYEAHQAGETTLSASGDPLCRKSQPPCAMPSRLFRIQIVVQPKALLDYLRSVTAHQAGRTERIIDWKGEKPCIVNCP